MATQIIQSPRRIQSPGVQITETDLTRRGSAPAPIRPAALVTGFAAQGPTDQLVKIRSMAQFNTVFGLPETSAERYLSHTVEETVSTGSDVYVSRLPYGKNGGDDDIENYYSALLFPILPHGNSLQDSENFYVLRPTSVLISEDDYQNKIKEGNIKWNHSFDTSVKKVFGGRTLTLNRNVASSIFLGVVNELRPTDKDYVNSLLPFAAYDGPIIFANQYMIEKPLTSFNIQASFNTRIQEYIDDLVYNNRNIVTDVNRLGRYQGAPTSWASVKTDITTLSTWSDYLTGSGTSNIEYDVFYHTKDSLNNLTINSIDDIHKAGLIIVNKDKLTINDYYEGFYVGLADNSDDTPYTNFTAITSIFSINALSGVDNPDLGIAKKVNQTFKEIPEERLNFTLTESYSSVTFSSLSERMSRIPSYDFSQDAFNDSLKLILFRLNTTPFLRDSVTLDYGMVEAYVGSLYSKRRQNDPRGGRLVNFFLENRIENNFNSRINFVVNPNISEYGSWVDQFGRPTKRVRVADGAKSLWGSGIYHPTNLTNKNKQIGNLSLKLDRTFQLCELTENESTFIDIICEGGLGTINAGVSAAQYMMGAAYDGTFDDSRSVDISNLKVIPKNWRAYYDQPDPVRDGYADVVRRFSRYAQTRKDHVFICDPLRYLFVNGRNSKISDKKASNFVDDVLRPMNVTFARVPRSTYMTVYANWLRKYDGASDEFTWIPPSGPAGRIMLNAKKRAPWTAPAGFNYGRIFNIVDMAINPNQRQRDLLYRSSYNPIANFPREGMVIFGQKTFIHYQSAFDRLNVRNLFLFLEKATTRILNRYVFEPNTISTRNRVVLSLTPIFERAKIRQGLFDYRLVCDERNNTDRTIDNNELRVAIYIQPVRTAEFILADFVATRTGTDLDALIG